LISLGGVFETLAPEDRASQLTRWSKAWLSTGVISLILIAFLAALLRVRVGPCPDDLVVPLALVAIIIPSFSFAVAAAFRVFARRAARRTTT
jgi:hypothetical protein